ncbi:MAG TPA: pyridoxamine 5'-phosphate oxidase family protein [Longimicrobiales bacterium]
MTDRAAVLEMMEGCPVVYFATVDGTEPRIRALENLRRPDRYPELSGFCGEQGFTCYFTTSVASDKVRQLRANPAAAAYFCDPAHVHSAMVTGKAEVLDDPELRRRLWSDLWRIYWTGWDDPDYIVVRLTAEDVRGWWGTSAFALERSEL